MARTNVENIDRPLIGCTVGQVKKAGWYLSCLSTFNHDKTFSYYDTTAWVNKYKYLDLTAGAIFRCKNAFYGYVGAGWAKRINTGEHRGGVNIETGAMFHFKNLSFMTGIYGILRKDPDFGFQLGLGYNF